MSKYTKAVHFELEFEGDTIKISMTRMKRADYLKMVPFTKVDDDTGDVTMSFSDKMEFMSVTSDMLPKYIKKFEGLVADNGDAITFDDVLEEVYFMDIITSLVERMFDSSGLMSKKKKADKDDKDEADKDECDKELVVKN